MYKLIIIFLFSLLFITIGCHRENIYDEKIISNSDFSLEKDISKFSETMTESDTIFLFTDLSVCMLRLKYYNCITKSHDTVFIETKSIDNTENNDGIIINHGKTIYTKNPNDSLNLEDMICYIQKNANKNKDLYRPTLQITHNNDTLSYQLNGILKILDLTHYYVAIMEKFYPIEEIYPFYEIINNEKNNHKIDSIVPYYEIKK